MTKTDVRVFLGLVGYYRQFINNFSLLAVRLSDLTKKDRPDRVAWTAECATSFQALKYNLCSDAILRPPCYDHPFCLQTDASGRGIGAELTQKDDDLTEHPVDFFSRKLGPRETRYSATKKEGLAVVEACRHYLPYLLGHHFDIWTDHKALSFLNHPEPRSPRLARWMDILRQFHSPSIIDLVVIIAMQMVSPPKLGLCRRAKPRNRP